MVLEERGDKEYSVREQNKEEVGNRGGMGSKCRMCRIVWWNSGRVNWGPI